MIGLIFSHHWVLGMRCLQQKRKGVSKLWFTLVPVSIVRRKCESHSKSVSPFNSVSGWKVSALFLMPRTQAESVVLANIRPEGGRNIATQFHLHKRRSRICLQVSIPCLQHSFSLSVSQITDLAPIFVPKFLSKGVGVPPCGHQSTEAIINCSSFATPLNLNHLHRPVACVRGHSYGNQRRLCPPLSTS